MSSKFRVCIAREDGDPVYLVPGGLGERDLEEAIVNKILSKGVGFWRTESHVRKSIEAGLDEVLHELKAEVIPS